MQKILSIVADFNHIIHPLRLPIPSQPRKPTVVDRITGIMCLVLTVPFTLGILTGFYFYWAKRKVALIDNSRAEKIHQVVTQIFGKAAASPEAEPISSAAHSLFSGKKEKMSQHLETLANSGLLTPPVKEAFLEMVITNNQVGVIEELVRRFINEEFPIANVPLHKARSGKMVEELIRLGVPVNGEMDGRKRTALYYASSVEVARALVRNGARALLYEDKYCLRPLNVVTSVKILKAILFEYLDLHHTPLEERSKAAEHILSDAFYLSVIVFEYISGEPEGNIEIDNLKVNLRANMKALLNCMKPETLTKGGQWLSICIEKLKDPELLSLLIDKGADVSVSVRE